MIKYLLLTFSMCFSLLACSDAQTDNTSSSSKSATAYETAFAAKYPSAKKVKWNVDSHGYHEAEFELDDEDYRADFDEDGNWRETEQSMKYGDLPEAVKKTIKEQYDKDDIEEVEMVDSATKGIFYDVELKDDGKKWDVEISPDGKIIAVVE